jgi:hypothetical protein
MAQTWLVWAVQPPFAIMTEPPFFPFLPFFSDCKGLLSPSHDRIYYL